MNRDKWVWMPHAAHCIVGDGCKFHLATYVGKYLVSTIGEYLPPEGCWDFYAEEKGVELSGKGDERKYQFITKVGYVEIGCGRKYETMVFTAKKSTHECCPYVMDGWIEMDFLGYNDPGEAAKGHLKLCSKWSKK